MKFSLIRRFTWILYWEMYVNNRGRKIVDNINLLIPSGKIYGFIVGLSNICYTDRR